MTTRHRPTTRRATERELSDVAAVLATGSEEREAMQERVVEGVPAAAAVRYPGELGRTWEAADGGTGRQMLAQALFERIEVRGFREVTLRLTENALAHGFGAVLPERFGISVSGRGERTSPDTFQLSIRIVAQRPERPRLGRSA